MPPPVPAEAWERAPTRSELSQWDKLIQQYHKAQNAIDACNLWLGLLQNLQSFAEENGFQAPRIDPSLLQLLDDIKQRFAALTRGIRGVEDHTLGVHYRYKVTSAGNTPFDDIDIVAPSEESADAHGFGAIGIVIVGVIVVVGAIALAYWATKNAIETADQLESLVKKADKALCSDPTSTICQKWKADKLETNFEERASLADSISSGVTKVGSTIVLGALALLALSLFGR